MLIGRRLQAGGRRWGRTETRVVGAAWQNIGAACQSHEPWPQARQPIGAKWLYRRRHHRAARRGNPARNALGRYQPDQPDPAENLYRFRYRGIPAYPDLRERQTDLRTAYARRREIVCRVTAAQHPPGKPTPGESAYAQSQSDRGLLAL